MMQCECNTSRCKIHSGRCAETPAKRYYGTGTQSRSGFAPYCDACAHLLGIFGKYGEMPTSREKTAIGEKVSD